MKRRSALLVATAGLLGAASSPDEKAVLDALEKYRQGAMKKDKKLLDEVFDDQLMYSHSSAKLETKAEAITALLNPDSKYDIMLKPQTVHLYGNTAVVRGDATFNVTTGGNKAVNELNILTTWVKSARGWRMVARQSTRLPK